MRPREYRVQPDRAGAGSQKADSQPVPKCNSNPLQGAQAWGASVCLQAAIGGFSCSRLYVRRGAMPCSLRRVVGERI